MTYALSAALQGAVYDILQNDMALTALVGDAVYDAVPPGSLPETYVRLGSETTTAASDGSGAGAQHRFTVTVITSAPGFTHAKNVAAAICDALRGATPALSRGRVVDLYFYSASAMRVDAAATRQIDLQFRAHLADE